MAKNKLRKKEQRKINRFIREFNQCLVEDDLWRGRFTMKQTEAQWYQFDDNSGGVLNIGLEIRDLKTGLYWTVYTDNFSYKNNIWQKVNRFIIDFSEVWENIDLVKNDKTDWTKVKWVPKESVPEWC